MNYEIPSQEHPNEIITRVNELEIGLDLRRHPELARRLSEIGSHFDDSLDIARIIRKVYDPLREALNLEDGKPEHLMRAAVLHDIGKSGPAGAEGDYHRAVQKLFVPPERPFSPYDHGHARTIAEYAVSQDWPDHCDTMEALVANGIDPTTMPMIDFWRQHVQWTYDILRSEIGDDVDSKVVLTAASHHMYEHRDPAGLHPEASTELSSDLKMAGVIEIVDKYQASRGRWHRNHEDSIAWLNDILAKQPDMPPHLAANFRVIVDVLQSRPDCL